MRRGFSLPRTLLITIAAVAALSGILPTISSVSADTQEPARELQWTQIDKPGTTGFTVFSPSDVAEIAIGSSVAYAGVINTPTTRLFRSLNHGYFWEDITSYLAAEVGAALTPDIKLAVAPDQSSIVAAATNSGLYLSVDGGITWGNVYLSGITGTIQSIAISKTFGEENEQRDILVGTAVFGDAATTGQVHLLHLGSDFPVWRNLYITVDPAHVGGEVSAVAFSPHYDDDQTILTVASTNVDVAAGYQNRTYACMAEVDLSTHEAVWNNRFGYPIEIFDSSYYTTLTQSLGDDIGLPSIAGGIELPSSFSASGSSGSSREFYAFYTVNPPAAVPPANDTSNAYKITDSTLPYATAFRPTATGTKRYCSIALCGGKLLAGEIFPSTEPDHLLSVPVQLCNDPGASPPQFNNTSYPYGAGNALVACSGSAAYCSTGQHPTAPASPDESGFSVSDDNGGNWFQISLIDTDLLLQDIAVASSPQSIFLVSKSTTNVQSVWRSAGTPLGRTWGRILAITVPSSQIIIRLSPDYREDYTVYVCEVNSTVDNSQFWFSTDRGNRWVQDTAPIGVIDMAPAGDETVYLALTDGKICKSTTNGNYWQKGIFSELAEIAMILFVDSDTLLAAGNHGDVSYTTDGAESFTRIPKIAGYDSTVQVIADNAYKDNNLIYAGTTNTIYRWVIGQSSDWEKVRAAANGEQISGFVIPEGILYALWYNGTSSLSGAERSLEPSLTFTELEWDSLQVGAENALFNISPTALRYTETETCVILWAIDTVSDEIMVYFDCLAWQNPHQILADEAVIGCDPATGRAQEVNFAWDDICADNRYQLQISKDTVFSEIVFDSGDAMPFLLPADIESPSLVYFEGTTSPALAGIASPTLECGHTYYWRVRARAAVTGDIIRSPWSDTHAFTIKAGFLVTTPYYGPQLLAPENACGCSCSAPVCFSWSPFKETTLYRFELADNADMNSPLVSTDVTTTAYQYDGQLNCNTSYFWRVSALEPAPSEWSTVFTFNIAPDQVQSSSSTSSSVSNRTTPLFAWVIIAMCIAFIIAATMLIISLMRGTGRIK